MALQASPVTPDPGRLSEAFVRDGLGSGVLRLAGGEWPDCWLRRAGVLLGRDGTACGRVSRAIVEGDKR